MSLDDHEVAGGDQLLAAAAANLQAAQHTSVLTSGFFLPKAISLHLRKDLFISFLFSNKRESSCRRLASYETR